MRSPNASDLGVEVDEAIRLFRLDVTDPELHRRLRRRRHRHVRRHRRGGEQRAAMASSARSKRKPTREIRRQFETNLFGVMNVTRAVLPHMRERQAGRIVNVASMAGRMTIPLYSAYCATKWALEGFSEALWLELRHQNIKVKIIEPGVIRTDFFERSQEVATKPGLTAYDQVRQARVAQRSGLGSGRRRAERRGKKHLARLDQHLAAPALPSQRDADHVFARARAGESLCARRAAGHERVVRTAHAATMTIRRPSRSSSSEQMQAPAP